MKDTYSTFPTAMVTFVTLRIVVRDMVSFRSPECPKRGTHVKLMLPSLVVMLPRVSPTVGVYERPMSRQI